MTTDESCGPSFVLTVIKPGFKCISETDDVYVCLTYIVLDFVFHRVKFKQTLK
jgi:hypothetical protein